MVKNKKVSSKKKGSVDFKKIKRKIGRKLPPPKNATNTEIKSKAIILPEQSIVSEKVGLAVSRKGLTMKELLQNTSHYNPKVRKDSLIGMKELFLKFPEELKLHPLAVIGKLCERICDDDRMVRESLYQLLKSVIFPCLTKEYTQTIPQVMLYVFNAMNNLSTDIRLMAFKFLDLTVQHYPSSFSLYSKMIFQNYDDILCKSRSVLLFEGKLNNILEGLVRCLLLLPSDKSEDSSTSREDVNAQECLFAYKPDVPEYTAVSSDNLHKLKDFVETLMNCFQDFASFVQKKSQHDRHAFDAMCCVLQCVLILLKFFIHKNKENQHMRFSPPFFGESEAMLGQIIAPSKLKKLLHIFPLSLNHYPSEKDMDKLFALNVMVTEIILHSVDWESPGTWLDKVLEFITGTLLNESSLSDRPSREKYLVPLIPFIPTIVWQVGEHWRSLFLKDFTRIFRGCTAQSPLKWACLSAVEEMLVKCQSPEKMNAPIDPELLGHQIIWIRELPRLLLLLGDKQPQCSRKVLALILGLGKCAPVNSHFVQEYDQMQYAMLQFYSTFLEEGNVSYGPFVSLGRENQDLALSCVYYHSHVDRTLLESIARCFLCKKLEQFILGRIISVLDLAFRNGHVQIADQLSFIVTVLSKFKVSPDNEGDVNQADSLRLFTRTISNNLLQMGDKHLILHCLERCVIDKIAILSAPENICALLRILIRLDSRPTLLSEQSVATLSNCLPTYMINVASCYFEAAADTYKHENADYYLLPCLFMFHRCKNLLNIVLKEIGCLAKQKSSPEYCTTNLVSRISAIVTIIEVMYKDEKTRLGALSSCLPEIELIFNNFLEVQKSEDLNMPIQERHNIQTSINRLKMIIGVLSNDNNPPSK